MTYHHQPVRSTSSLPGSQAIGWQPRERLACTFIETGFSCVTRDMFTCQTALRSGRLRLCDSGVPHRRTIEVRHVSLNSAIRIGRKNVSERREGDRNSRTKYRQSRDKLEKHTGRPNGPLADSSRRTKVRRFRDEEKTYRREDHGKSRLRELQSQDRLGRHAGKSNGAAADARGRAEVYQFRDEPETGTRKPSGLWAAAIRSDPRLQKHFERQPGRYNDSPKTSRAPKDTTAAERWGYHSGRRYEASDDTVKSKILRVAPKQIPYTTPTSEFIYGTSVVQSAIRCGRRKLHALYIYDSGLDKSMEETRWESSLGKSLAKYMLHAGGRVKHVTGTWAARLDTMCKGRPHNGFVLDASPLPRLPAVSYQRVESPASTEFHVELEPQPKEEAQVNGTDGRIQLAPYRAGGTTEGGSTKPERYPFTLLLDGVLDMGNLGSIIRSAHYLGVDAVAFSARHSAPLNPVTIKASAGAAESMPLISMHDPISFIYKSRKNGWRFFAAVAPASASSGDKGLDARPTTLQPSELSSALRESPCVLMLGSEETGLRKKLLNAADAFVGVPGVYTTNKEDQTGVDSLNVGVATAVLCEAFLRAFSDLRTEGISPNTKSKAAQEDDGEGRVF